jgi:hypothetical protein
MRALFLRPGYDQADMALLSLLATLAQLKKKKKKKRYEILKPFQKIPKSP